MPVRNTSRRIASLLAIFLLTACAAHPQAPTSDRLYRALGETAGITVIVDKFLYRLADDTRIAHFFGDTNIKRFRRLLIEQFCVESGGPCTYTGDSMQIAHTHMHLTDADFNALVEDLVAGMEDAHVPVGAQNGLLAHLAPMYHDIMSSSRHPTQATATAAHPAQSP
jgi:hemoglobin